MSTKFLHFVALASALILSAGIAMAQTTNAPAPSPVPALTQQSPASSEVAVLKAQLEMTRQYQDTFITMAQWTLGTAIAVALALGAFGWHTNKTNYDRDRASLERELVSLGKSLEVQVQKDLQAHTKTLSDELAAREKALRESVLRALQGKIDSLTAQIQEARDETLDLKEAHLEIKAEDAYKRGIHRTALRYYCELLTVHIEREQTQYFAASVLDSIRMIAKDSSATLDADSVTETVATLGKLPKNLHAATDPINYLLKRKLA